MPRGAALVSCAVTGVAWVAATSEDNGQAGPSREVALRQFFDATREGALILDGSGVCVRANRAACDMLGETEERLCGRAIHEILSPIADSGAKHLSTPFDSSESIEGGEFQITSEDGSRRVLQYEAEPLGDDHHIAHLRDITNLEQHEDQDQERKERLVQAERMISLGILVSGVAHEINNPNQLISSNVSLLHEAFNDILPFLDRYYEDNGDFLLGGLSYRELREQMPEILRETLAGSQRIQRIVRELRDYARPTAEASMEPLQLEAVASSAIRLTKNLIRKSTNRFSRHKHGAVPMVRGNVQRLEQVAINLIVNACQALPEPDRGLKVRVGYSDLKNAAILEVQDEGEGMSEETLKHITDPFFTTKRERGGMGLGLAICARIMHEHHGLLTFDSEPGKGTRARMILPIIGAPWAKKLDGAEPPAFLDG